jgi:ubiquinol-cytochrome c reductase cytochrome b subunit
MIQLVPLIGAPLERLVVGGSDYGHLTLTRFFALHAGVLPALLTVVLTLHILLFRRHGLTVRDPKRAPDTMFWPEQMLRDAVACLAVAIVVLVLVLRDYPTAEPGIPLAQQLGAELGAPANPAESYSAARPETYFLFLYQLLKYMDPFVGAIVVPGLVMLSLFLMPFIGRWEMGHRFNVVWTFALLVGAGVLTALAWHHDHNGKTDESKHYLEAVADAKLQAERAVILADSPTGIPTTGALTLLRNDPKIQGPRLFREHCAACHSHAPAEGSVADPAHVIVADKPSASNLWLFGSREWAAGILNPEMVASPHYFGGTAHKEGEMVTWVKDNIGAKLAELKGDELTAFRTKIDDVTFALAHESGMLREMYPAERVDNARKAITEEFACIDCHKFHEDGALGSAPDLTGYASREWLTAFISNPAGERFYRDTNDRMPAFVAHPENPNANRMTPDELGLLVSWLRGEWYEPSSQVNPVAK